MQTTRPMYADPGRQAQYERALAEEAARYAEIRRTAEDFLRACRALGGHDLPFYGGLVWLTQAAERTGCPTRLPADFLTNRTGYDTGRNGYGTGRNGWPATEHLRLHWLADRDGGWSCNLCGIGLVDVCSDEDMVTGGDGGRMIRPDSYKRLPVLDHKVPRQLGGSDDAGNLWLACPPCNRTKAAS